VQLEVLPHRELVVERKRLRHVADATARLEVAGIDFLAEEPGLALGGREQPREHLHRRRLAAAVRAEEAKDLAAADAEAHVVDGGEAAEAHRQVFRFDGDLTVTVGGQRRDFDRPMAAAFFFRQQRDEGLVERLGAGALQQFVRRAGGEHLAGIHGDEPVETRRFLHVGGGHEHAHAFARGANLIDEGPELAPRQGIDAGGRLVEDQELGIVDEGAT